MELIYSGVNVDRIYGESHAQTLVTGEIPFPEEQTLTKIHDALGSVSVTDTVLSDGEARVSGKVRVEFICGSESGGIVAFSSWADFEHTLSVDAADSSMKADVSAELVSVETSLNDGAITLSAVVELYVRAVGNTPLQLLGGIGGVSDMEFNMENVTFSKCSEPDIFGIRIRDEIAAPGVSAVLCANGNASLREIKCDGLNANIDGILTVNALYMGRDNRMNQLMQNIAFSESIQLDHAADTLSGTVEIESIQLRMLGEEFGIIAVEAQLSVSLCTSEGYTAELPIDAYSPSCPFCCERQNVSLMLLGDTVNYKQAFTESVAVPNDMPDVYRTVYCSYRPVLTGYNAEDGILRAEGLLFARIIYHDEQGNVQSFSEDIPFFSDIPVAAEDGAHADIKLVAVPLAMSGAGRTLDLSFSINVSAKLYKVTDIGVVTGAGECAAVEQPHGIIVYFTGKNETLFDIGKRFAISRERLKQCDTTLTEMPEEGKRIVMFV